MKFGIQLIISVAIMEFLLAQLIFVRTLNSNLSSFSGSSCIVYRNKQLGDYSSKNSMKTLKWSPKSIHLMYEASKQKLW